MLRHKYKLFGKNASCCDDLDINKQLCNMTVNDVK